MTFITEDTERKEVLQSFEESRFPWCREDATSLELGAAAEVLLPDEEALTGRGDAGADAAAFPLLEGVERRDADASTADIEEMEEDGTGAVVISALFLEGDWDSFKLLLLLLLLLATLALSIQLTEAAYSSMRDVDEAMLLDAAVKEEEDSVEMAPTTSGKSTGIGPPTDEAALRLKTSIRLRATVLSMVGSRDSYHSTSPASH